MSSTIRLTPTQRSAMLHRLEAADALLDALDNDDLVPEGLSHEDALVEIETLSTEVRDHSTITVYGPSSPFRGWPVFEFRNAAVVECIEGSTWVAVHYDETEPLRCATAIRTLRSIAHRLEPLLGYEPDTITIPEA